MEDLPPLLDTSLGSGSSYAEARSSDPCWDTLYLYILQDGAQDGAGFMAPAF
jgi:hypothetical protein